MTKKSPPAFNPSRRATLVKTGAALGASVLPFGLLAAGQSAPASASRPGTYRRYNASRSAAGKQMLKSYAKAVRAMLALPPEDPRNWYRHAIIHTLDCPHGNWWFLPWHRGYLGWFEQICRELSGDPRFTLPYWDWTAEPRVPDGMYFDVLDPNHEAYIPTASDFENRLRSAIANSGYWTSPGGVFTSRSQYGQLLARGVRFDEDLLFDILRDPSGRLFHDQPGARGLRRERPQFNAATSDSVSSATIRAALDAPDFPTFGSPKSSNHGTPAGFGILEAKPHNSVHRCVGSRDCNFVEAQGFMTDMLSPVDPIFFLHHANMDRLWDVWERKQKRLGLPTMPNGVELRTDLPEAQKSAEEKATDYYRWAREPMLFFVDKEGAAVTKTRGGDYASMAAFGYDYEPGSGEEVVPPKYPRARAAGPRIFQGKVLSREVHADKPASAAVAVPAATLDAAVSSGTTLVANITLNFVEMSHDPYVVVLNGPDDLTGVDAASPFYLGTIIMFGHHRNCGTLTYALPLGEKLGAAGASQRTSSDGTLRVRVVPMHTAMKHHGMGDAGAVELVAVNVETY
jgi:tyrosinase